MKDERAIDAWIKHAVEFHGHLGPFLVIGVKLGNLAKKTLNLNAEEMHRLRVTAALPLFTPYSCVLDGIQVTTCCTIGNQKLRIRDSNEIVLNFEVLKSDKLLQISVNPIVVKEMAEKMAMGTVSDELARGIVLMPEKELFILQKQ